MKYAESNITEVQNQIANEPSAEYSITIPIKLPSTGSYTLESLTKEITDFAMHLISIKKNQSDKAKRYSATLKRLQSLNRNLITTQDLNTDERLAYLLNK